MYCLTYYEWLLGSSHAFLPTPKTLKVKVFPLELSAKELQEKIDQFLVSSADDQASLRFKEFVNLNRI